MIKRLFNVLLFIVLMPIFPLNILFNGVKWIITGEWDEYFWIEKINW